MSSLAPTPTDVNFSNTDPPAPAGRTNVAWQASKPYGILVNINGVDVTLQFRDVSGNVPTAGSPGGSPQPVFEIALAPTVPGPFTVAHGLAAAPVFVIIQMDSGGEIWLQKPLGFDATNLYLVASDGGITGTAVCFTVAPDATLPLAPGAPGNFTVAHGLTAAPALVLVQMTSGGEIWFQVPTAWDATNIYLDASDAGVTGVAYAWLTVPVLQVLIPFKAIPLAPSVPGDFQVAHGLGRTPTLVIISMNSGGEIWLQSPVGYDDTYLYLVASDDGVSGSAYVWAD